LLSPTAVGLELINESIIYLAPGACCIGALALLDVILLIVLPRNS